MNIKEESCFPDLCSENEGDTKNLVKKARIEIVTTSNDIKSKVEDSTCSESEKHDLMRLNETIKESEIDTKIDIKQEDWWLRRAVSYTNDGMKDEADEDVYSTKPPRLVPEIKESNIRSSNNFEMDTKLKMKEEESLPDDVAPQNVPEFFHKVVSMKRSSDAVLVDDHCDETEIKSEAPFTKHLVKEIKSEAVTCHDKWEIDREAIIDEQTVISDFGSQSKGELLSEVPIKKLGKFNSAHEMGNKIEIKEEPLWLEIETSDTCDDIKYGDFPPVNWRLCTQGVSSGVSGKSLLFTAEVSGRGTNFYPGRDNPEYEYQKSNDTELPSAEEHVLSEQSGICNEKNYMCIRSLKLKQNSLIHKRKRPHKHETSDNSLTRLSHLKKHNLIQGKKHKCKSCDKGFRLLSDLKRHSLIHEGRKPHQCNTCDKSFMQLSNLKTHYLLHKGEKPHQCKTCDKRFTQLSHLQRHYLLHEGKKPHQCKTCDKSFSQLSNLKTHYLIHEGKKPHQCKTCDKRFTQLSHLKRHYLLHEGKKPHQCKTCDKSFSQLSNLKTHYLIHEGKKPHKCKTCDKSFVQLGNLKTHYLIHEGKKPHQCKTCDKSFTRLSYLNIHYLIHEGKKPHQCKTCDKSFTQLGSLNIHSLVHEGKKPHKCNTCNKSFRCLSNLKRHYLTHESKK